MLSDLLLVAVLLGLSAFFSSTEMAYASVSEIRLRQASEAGGRRQQLAYWIYRHYGDALTTLLFGNNLVNIAASSVSTVIVIGLLGEGYTWVATLAMTVLLLIFGEIVPKAIAKERADEVAGLSAYPLRGLMFVLYPVIVAVRWFVGLVSRLWQGKAAATPSVTEGDIEIILDTAEDEGAIDEITSDLLQSALEFEDVMAYEIITPRVDMIAIDVEDSPEEILSAVLGSPYSRIPVYEESKDNIVGLLHQNRFMKRMVCGDGKAELRGMLLPAYFVPKTATLPSVLSTMRQKNCHMVIVSDEFGGTLGILTMEDVLEELVGDIWDETDEINAEFRLLPDGRYEASGDMRMADFLEMLDMDDRDFDGESTTLGGWVVERLGSYPCPGDAFEYEGLRVEVEEIYKRRVKKVAVGVLAA